MPVISKTYAQEAEFLLPYILPLLQTSLTVSVYSTVAITLHGLHEIQKSTEISIPSSHPSNIGDGVEYHSVVSAAGKYNKITPATLLSFLLINIMVCSNFQYLSTCSYTCYSFAGVTTTVTLPHETPYVFPQSSTSDLMDGRPTSNNWSSNNLYEEKSYFSCSKLLKNWGTRLTMTIVLVFGFGFNAPRWFEWEFEWHDEYYDYPVNTMNTHEEELAFNSIPYGTSNNEESDRKDSNNTSDGTNDTWGYHENITYEIMQDPEMCVKIRPSELKQNEDYILHYQLVGSCIVMILVPAAILLKAYGSFRKATSSRINKNRTHKIMLIIITMFIICHCPKVSKFCTKMYIICVKINIKIQ